jgi:two-component system nitrogen regulation response regulator GlnG
MNKLLIIDDDPLVCQSLQMAFSSAEVQVEIAMSAADGVCRFEKSRPDVVLLDIGLPDQSGLELVCQFAERDAKVPVIVMTGLGSSAMAIEAMQLGAYEYVEKPFELRPLYDLVDRAFESAHLMRIPAVLPDTNPAASESADILIGRCPTMQEVYRAIGRAARQTVTVLILGESGTGKEVVARALYHYSQRNHKPFLAINCAAIPETLLESELFGHERGSFTGADRRRIGKFEQCDGGTLFLDEIGDMTPLTQAKILRVLQDQQFERVGGTETIRTDVRLIAATNRNLRKMMEQGQFREDLFYRLNVYTIQLPALRNRPGDIALLIQHFLQRYGRELGREPPQIAVETMDLLEHYSWPGNVRELQSVLRHALVETTGPVILPESLPPYLRSVGSVPAAGAATLNVVDGELKRFISERLNDQASDLLSEVVERVERQLYTQAWRHTQGNISQIARLLGVTRVTARAKLNAYGISVAPADEAAS